MVKKIGGVRILYLIVLIVLLTIGAFVFVAHATPPPTPTILKVTRPHNPLRPELAVINKRITNAAAVQKLYQAALALPEASSALRHCPADYGMAYKLTFLDHDTKIKTMELKITGCQALSIDTDTIFNHKDARDTNTAFNDLFSHTIGFASTNDLYK
ncbi:hypothetical protein KDW_44410 [Dictyobacter vulcani]|uniref:Uncharacterized protein n=1 Tax=Dictyobacter vulcani TaxID=2607529 RepID=A0A5J4KVX9_9CHLR|nr:hypothetical protein [Dictyobacter vulcani]GER90279.1 hypothetical protein KDW_44410 [Dictyobacter vulcani]